MPPVLLGLGSNLEDRGAKLAAGLESLAATGDVRIERCSTWIETPPVGGPPDQPPYLNGAALVESSLSPEELLARLHAAEQAHGRTRNVAWGPRTLDIDLLLYDEATIRTERLIVPHPRMAYRKFVLRPAAEIAGGFVHPTLRRTLRELLEHLDTSADYAAFVGHSAGYRSQFAGEAANAAQARLVEPTPADVPTLERVLEGGHTTATAAIEFLQARSTAIRASIAAATGQWIIDDAWLEEEAAALVRHVDDAERETVTAAWQHLRADAPPKLLVALREPTQLPHDYTLQLAQMPPFSNTLPPMVEVGIADREAALGEIAAALAAAT